MLDLKVYIIYLSKKVCEIVWWQNSINPYVDVDIWYVGVGVFDIRYGVLDWHILQY